MKLTTVKLCRFERHLLQMQVAKCADIPWTRLAEIENGTVEARPDELERIASALGVSAQELRPLPAASIGYPGCAAAPSAPGLDLIGELGLPANANRVTPPAL